MLKNEQMIKWLLAENEYMWQLFADHYKITLIWNWCDSWAPPQGYNLVVGE